MKHKILVTLVSEQAIPNVQYFKEFMPTSVWFITSKAMKEKVSTLSLVFKEINRDVHISAIQNEDFVNEEDYSDIYSKIERRAKSLDLENYDEIIVNATLGTKIMSLALCDYFKNDPKAIILYSPIRKNKYKSVFDNSIDSEFATKVSFKEYFSSYGVEIKSSKLPIHSFDYTKKYLEYYRNFTQEDIDILEFLREGTKKNAEGKVQKLNYRSKGVKNIDDVKGLDVFLKRIAYPLNDNKLSNKEVEYLTGNWFEEWVYEHIKNKYNLSEEQIGLGVYTTLFADNDLDIVYLINNNLHVVECKTRINKQLMESTLYKSGALNSKFGVGAKSYIFTLEDLSKMNEGQRNSIELRALQQRIDIKEKNDILNLNF